LIKYFCGGVTACAAAGISGANRNTAILFYHKLREVIFAVLEAEAPEFLSGEIEVDESYFGGHRKDRCGRGAAGKVPVFGLLKRHGNIHGAIIANARSDRLIQIIREKIRQSSVTYTDALRINYSRLFADQRNHINGIENFWNKAKRHLLSYNGIPRQHVHLFIKRVQWRFNYRPIGRMHAPLMRWWFK
jgi:transposase